MHNSKELIKYFEAFKFTDAYRALREFQLSSGQAEGEVFRSGPIIPEQVYEQEFSKGRASGLVLDDVEMLLDHLKQIQREEEEKER